MRGMCVALGVLVACLCCPGSATAQQDLDALLEQSFKQAAALLNPSIVQIQTVGGLDRVAGVVTGTGPTTGVVVSEDGFIVSSAFNFAAKPASILVNLPDGRRLPARLVANDHAAKITLLKIEADNLLPAKPAPRDAFRVGQWSLALGRTYTNAFPSVSVGIISALDRAWGRAVQTDAKVSPVNYGGPLATIDGKVFGILVPLSPRGQTETAGVEWYDSGIGFAIPLVDVYRVLDRLKQGENLKPGLMGINFEGRDQFGPATIGMVRPASPAAEAGLKKGDRITMIDNAPIERKSHVRYALGRKYAGDMIRLKARRNDQEISVQVTLTDKLLDYQVPYLGLLPERADKVQDSATDGVVVRYVFPQSPAAQAGLMKRDRITAIAGKPVTDSASLIRALGGMAPDDKVSLSFTRQDKVQSLELTLGALPDTIPGELPTVSIPPVERADAKAADPQVGRFTVELPAHQHSYWAYVPPDYNPDFQYGLMVWLHPTGDTMEAAIMRLWKSVCARRNLMIIAPKAGNPRGWNPAESVFVKAAVEDFVEQYPIDRSRVFVHGYATGGVFALSLLFKERELFAGAAVASATLRTPPPPNTPYYRIQLHFNSGSADADHARVARTVEGLRKMKYPVSFAIAKDRSKKYPSQEDVREIGRWADSLDRI